LGTRFLQPSRRGSAVILVTGVLLAVFFAGFSKNFYLRAWMGRRPLTALAYAHGFLMTAWLLLFIGQVILVARSRVDLHRRLGAYGMCAAVGVVILGLATIFIAVQRQAPSASLATYAEEFIAFDGLNLLLFGTLVGYAYRIRRIAPSHRRLMLMSLVALLPPAFGRLVALVRHDDISVIVLSLMVVSALACIMTDYIASKKLHAAVVLPALAIIAANIATFLAQQFD
jgi:hypothetical protein